jgi:predicted lipid carrier protein YhbT
MAADAPTSVEAAAEWLRKRFEPDAARGVSLGFALELSGPEGGRIGLRIEDGALDVRPEAASPGAVPDVTLRLAAEDFYGVLAGRENSELLFMAGRVAIDGDPALALRLRTFFRRRA